MMAKGAGSILLVSFLAFQFSAWASGPQWGLRPYSDEAPRYEALVKELETEEKTFETRRDKARNAVSRIVAEWSAEQRDEAEAAFHSSRGSKLNADLSFYEEERNRSRDAYREVLEGASTDPKKDDPIGMSQRDSLWSAHIRYLRTTIAYLRCDSLYQEQKQRFLQSYLFGSVERYLGINLDEFIEDTLDDAIYVVAGHADKFFDALLDCAVKEVVHYIKEWPILRKRLTEAARHDLGITKRWESNPPKWHSARQDLGTVEPYSIYPGLKGVSISCMEDILRASIVTATVNALRKNFIDDMGDAGVDPLVAEYWWSKYIIQEQKPTAEDPWAPRVKSVSALFQERLESAFRRIATEQFMLKQTKKTLKIELDMAARGRLKNQVFQKILPDTQKQLTQIELTTPSAGRRNLLMRQTQRDMGQRVREEGVKMATEDFTLKFLKWLDWGTMLFEQAVSAGVYTSRTMNFKEVAALLIEDYRRIETCLIRQKMATGAHAVLAIFRMGKNELQAFFSQCDVSETDMQQVAGQRMLAKMDELLVQTRTAAGTLDKVCPGGEQALRKASENLAFVRDNARRFLENMKRAPRWMEEIEGLTDRFRTDADEARRYAADTVTARKRAEEEAEKTCVAVKAMQGESDPQRKFGHKRRAQTAASASIVAAKDADQHAGKAVRLREKAQIDAAAYQEGLAFLVEFQAKIAEIRARAEEVTRFSGEADQAADAADETWRKLKDAQKRAAELLAEAETKLKSSKDQEVRGLLAAIRDKAKQVSAMAANLALCPRGLRKKSDELAADLQNLTLTMSALTERVDKITQSKDPSNLGREFRDTLSDLVSAAEVAEIFRDAAGSAAEEARVCLDLFGVLEADAGGLSVGDASLNAASRLEALRVAVREAEETASDVKSLCSAAEREAGAAEKEARKIQASDSLLRARLNSVESERNKAGQLYRDILKFHSETEKAAARTGEAAQKVEALSLKICEGVKTVKDGLSSKEGDRILSGIDGKRASMGSLMKQAEEAVKGANGAAKNARRSYDQMAPLLSAMEEVKNADLQSGRTDVIERKLKAVEEMMASAGQKIRRMEEIRFHADEIMEELRKAVKPADDGKKAGDLTNAEQLVNRIGKAHDRVNRCSDAARGKEESTSQMITDLKANLSKLRESRQVLFGNLGADGDSPITQAHEKTEMAEYVLELAKGYLERLKVARADADVCFSLTQEALSGPRTAAVPDVSGMVLEQASNLIRQNGLNVDARTLGGAQRPDLEYVVTSQNPAAGSRVDAGATVVLTYHGPFEPAQVVDCSRFPGTSAVWDEESRKVICMCLAGLFPNAENTGCIDCNEYWNSFYGALMNGDVERGEHYYRQAVNCPWYAYGAPLLADARQFRENVEADRSRTDEATLRQTECIQLENDVLVALNAGNLQQASNRLAFAESRGCEVGQLTQQLLQNALNDQRLQARNNRATQEMIRAMNDMLVRMQPQEHPQSRDSSQPPQPSPGSGEFPGRLSGGLDPNERAALIAKHRPVQVNFESSAASVNVYPDGSAELQSPIQCTITLTDNRPSGNMASYTYTFTVTLTPNGRASGLVVKALRKVDHIFEFVERSGRRGRKNKVGKPMPVQGALSRQRGVWRLGIPNGNGGSVGAVSYLLR